MRSDWSRVSLWFSWLRSLRKGKIWIRTHTERIQRERRSGDASTSQETLMNHQPTTRGCRGAQDWVALTALRRNLLCWQLDFWPPELWDNKCVIWAPQQRVPLCYGSVSKLIHLLWEALECTSWKFGKECKEWVNRKVNSSTFFSLFVKCLMTFFVFRKCSNQFITSRCVR